jgi:hypothetical protein
MATAKRKPAKRPAAKRTEIVVRVEQPTTALVPTATELAEPMRDGKKLTIPKTWVTENQLVHMLQRTPSKYVYTRPGKGGGNWAYVTAGYVTKCLNYIFGWNWDYEKVSEPTVTEIIKLIESKIDQVWVTGKLTVRGNDGHQIVKTQAGRAEIKFRKDTRTPVDIGNDIKSAYSDALKKCASLLGIASDIYNAAEFRDETGKAPAREETEMQSEQSVEGTIIRVECKPGQVIGQDGNPTWKCAKCDEPITEQVASYSMAKRGKRLCANCQ